MFLYNGRGRNVVWTTECSPRRLKEGPFAGIKKSRSVPPSEVLPGSSNHNLLLGSDYRLNLTRSLVTSELLSRFPSLR